MNVREKLDVEGRIWLRGALSDRMLAALDNASNLDEMAGERLGLTPTLDRVFCGKDGLGAIMDMFARDLVPVRVIAFNKTVANNWAVPRHQDRVIAVAARHEHPGFRNWSRKGGVWHCEPPADFLGRMFFVRVHLDACGPADGAMRIALGSHRQGVVPASDAGRVAESLPFEDCVAARGDVLVLKMLTLHASPPSVTSNPRRVFRVDYAPADLLPLRFSWL